MSEDGLYLHKRHIRGDHGRMLEQAGTVLQHTLIYLKQADKVCTPVTSPGRRLADHLSPTCGSGLISMFIS